MRKKSVSEIAKFEDRSRWNVAKLGVPEDGSYCIGQAHNLKLMSFQVGYSYFLSGMRVRLIINKGGRRELALQELVPSSAMHPCGRDGPGSFCCLSPQRYR